MRSEAGVDYPPKWFWSASWSRGVISTRILWRHLLIKAPWHDPLWSERSGARKPVWSWRGWRVFHSAPPQELRR